VISVQCAQGRERSQQFRKTQDSKLLKQFVKATGSASTGLKAAVLMREDQDAFGENQIRQ
jgi:hypothetical protein